MDGEASLRLAQEQPVSLAERRLNILQRLLACEIVDLQNSVSVACRTKQWQGKNHPRWVDGGVELAPHDKWSYLRRQYQLTEEKFFNLLAKQNGVCPICRTPLIVDFANRHGRDALVIDHDHRCCPDQKKSCGRCVRGILHMSCNTGIGALKDNPVLCRNAAEYLENYYVTQNQN